MAASVLALTDLGCHASSPSNLEPMANEVQGHYEVIRLHGDLTGTKRLNDGDPETGVGNKVLITEKLSRNGSKYGFSATMCTQAGGPLKPTPENPTTQLCSGVYNLDNGQVTWQNTLAVTREGVPAPWKTAITGGTGAYENARGYILVNGEKRDYTVYLVRTSSS
ncbi:hypothetical protein AB0N87_40320 [Streptomyces sp. NPDC093228]|jgi:hypothetical protein|uniref:hypothetical protein n=1 Tax=unclassified Streptomyces TaxID=2593676 RepID=UPI000AC0ECA1|nr:MULTISPECIES: hypothetical protein [unclassified Streptomyces]MDX3263376.1 hypothetical protein [Streptomyces sp. MI02-2A]REE65467.1 hypothetical protein BX257_8198 [Streptomyces sp. 3212.3]